MRLENKLIVVACHGIGHWNKQNSEKWFQSMQDRVIDLAFKLSAKQMPDNFVQFYPVTWGPKIQEIEDEFIREVEAFIPKGGFSPFTLSRNINNGIRRMMVDNYGDIMSSFEGYGWNIIEKCVEDTLISARTDALNRRALRNLPEDSQTPVMLIGHSLGSIILFKYCHKIGRSKIIDESARIEKVRGGLRLNSIVIYGSPITLWDRMAGGSIVPQFPSWYPLADLIPAIINIWCERDPLSAPLVPFFKERYPKDRVILFDRHIRVPGMVGKIPAASHGNYQKSRDAAFEIAKRIHLIWSTLRSNTLIDN